MSTYLQNNEYQTYNVTPYQLPGNEIAQAVDTRNQYWDRNASLLRNTYQNFLGLDLTHSQNKQKLDSLMQQANQGLKQAVQSDLSITPNAMDAEKLFDPIVKDSNIMGDHALTQHTMEQLREMESYKTKGNGSEYSQTNVNYLLQGLDSFAKDNPNNWQAHYANRRFATPYYDTAKEDRELLKTFKPSSTTVTFPDVEPDTITDASGNKVPNPKAGSKRSDYFITKIDKSAYDTQLKAYLSSNHSDKYRDQMGINGSVAYYGNEEALKKDYTDYNNTSINALKNQSDIIKAKLLTASEDSKNTLQHELTTTENSISDLTKENLKANTDKDYLKRNYERFAGSLYTDKFNSVLAAGNQRIDQSVVYKPDQVAMKYLSETKEDQRFYSKLQVEKDKSILDNQTKIRVQLLKNGDDGSGGTGTLLPGIQIKQQANSENNKTLGVQYLEDQIKTASANRDNALTHLTDSLIERIKQTTDPTFDHNKLNKMSKDQIYEMVHQFAVDNPNDPVYNEFLTSDRVYRNQKTAQDALREEALKDIPETDRININTLEGPITVTKKDHYRLFTKFPDIGVAPAYGGSIPERKFIEYNGKVIPLSEASYTELSNSGFNTRVNEALNKAVTNIKNEHTINVDQQKNPIAKAMRSQFVSRFGIDENEAKNVSIFSQDGEGTYYSLPNDIDEAKLGISKKKLALSVDALGDGAKTVKRDGRDLYFLPYSQTGFAPKSLTDPELKPFQDYFDVKKGTKTSTSVASPATMTYDPNRIGEYFSFKMDLYNGVPKFSIFHKDSKVYIGNPQEGNVGGFDSLEEAAAYIRNNFKTKKDVQEALPVLKNWK